MVMATTSLADAKARLSEIIKSAEATHERTVITKNGKPVAAIMSIEDLEALEETLEILSDPTLMAELRLAHAEPTEAWTKTDLMTLIRSRDSRAE